MLLITNNEKFLNDDIVKSKKIEIRYLEKDYRGVLEFARDLIHENYELLTHPLYGSVKPNETIFRTLVLSKGQTLDYNSLVLIEEALVTLDKFQKNKKTPQWIESVREDFSVIDYDIMKKTINRILD